MSPYQKKQKEKRRKNLFRKWHRRVGFTVAIFLLNLSITGILLNHSDDLELHKKYIKSSWLVNYYGITAPKTGVCLSFEQKQICQLGERIYLDNNFLFESTQKLIDIIKLEDIYFLATSNQIYLYTEEFELVESIKVGSEIANGVDKLGTTAQYQTTNNTIIIYSKKERWILDQDTMSLNHFLANKGQNNIEKTAKLVNLTDPLQSQLNNDYLAHQVTLLKFIQDLHSGRILSTPGKWLTDLVGIIIILLALSGFFAWQRRTEKVR